MHPAEGTASAGEVAVSRVYDERADDTALHALVDRLWPRGVRKTDPRIDDWWKELAPSADLRKWYEHDPARRAEFAARYIEELDTTERAADLARARAVVESRGLVLLTATKDLDLAHTGVLATVLSTS